VQAEGGVPAKKRKESFVPRVGGRGKTNREQFDEARKNGQRIAIDLGFDQDMTEREMKSLVLQLSHLYGVNRK
jgi:hypothetical protein